MTDFDKIGVNTLRPFKSKERWVFKYNETLYDLAPAGIMDVVLSPLIVGVDKLISIVCQLKSIPNSEEGFTLLFSEQFFPNADAKLNFSDQKHGGWIYGIEELNLKGFMPGQRVWLCPYMAMYYLEPPKTLYIKMEPSDGTLD